MDKPTVNHKREKQKLCVKSQEGGGVIMNNSIKPIKILELFG